MAFVHGLVKTLANGKRGWCAPVELGENAPHYVSFVVPLDSDRHFFSKYICEAITSDEGEKKVEAHELVEQKVDSFVLRIGSRELWFTARPGPAKKGMPYVGNLEHEDFGCLFAEIEPEDPELLDELYDVDVTFIVGCEPFTHYSNIESIQRKRQVK